MTPLMTQYYQVKSKYPDALLLFRVGDFYETFGEDAVTASAVLGITLTSRNNGGDQTPLAGVPYHSLKIYLPRLVKAGFRVAICEQLEKPSKEKKILKRGVTEIITPGIAIDDKLLEHTKNNYLCSIHYGRNNHYGIAFLDVSTGEFWVTEGKTAYVEKMLQSFNPSEIIFSKNKTQDFEQTFGSKFYVYPLEDWIYKPDYTREKLLEHFEVPSMKGFGIEELELAQIAAGSILHYLNATENKKLNHLTQISRIQQDRYVWLDRFTVRNLELIYSAHETGIPMVNILDKTICPMGARMLKRWIVLPLKDRKAIQTRHKIVAYFIENTDFQESMSQHIRSVGDIERLISKVPLGKINPREVVQLKKALSVMEPMIQLLQSTEQEELIAIADRIHPCTVMRNQIEDKIMDEPPVNLLKGGVIKDGVHEELDELRQIVKNSKDILLNIQQEEAEKTGITNLKIGFNNVFGYYLEVTNKYKNQGLVPENWVRKQTLTGSERYITEELKKLEVKILGAEDKILILENDLFDQLVQSLNEYIQPIQINASLIARIDCLNAFALVAVQNNYCRPTIDESLIIDIKDARHPVIEQHLPLGEDYVPNDIYLNNSDQQIMMITGPNMSGKSAVLRQTALIALMAQMGSYVPAKEATIGIIDKIFTRVGASDNISSGESTFMVEMNETASILNNVSERSLILLDEIGRGTSTYDGISIAWSIAEYLHNNPIANPKTLFATHYHELNELANKFPRVKNFSISTKEIGNKVIFLRKLIQGGSHHSFGIHVAKMAGMPKAILKRATEILQQLEKKSITNQQIDKTLQSITPEPYQMNIFEADDPLWKEIREDLEALDINALTPIESMMKLHELIGKIKE